MSDVNRYKKAGVPLNMALRAYSTITEVQDAFVAMQKAGQQVAEQLLNQSDGAYTIIYGLAHWVSPIGKQLELVVTQHVNSETHKITIDMNNLRKYVTDTVWDIEDISIEMLNGYSQAMKSWLASPTYYFADQDMLDKAALAQCLDTVVEETKAMSQAIKESLALENHIIQDNKAQSAMQF